MFVVPVVSLALNPDVQLPADDNAGSEGSRMCGAACTWTTLRTAARTNSLMGIWREFEVWG